MLKFILKKKSDGSQLEVASFNEMAEGDAWVARITASGKYGRNDISLLEVDLESHGLLPEQAASSEVSTTPKLDAEGNPVMDQQEPPQPVMQTLYHFAREWEVEIIDVTLENAHQNKIQSRAAIRTKCLMLIDEIASINKDSGATDVTMDTIFMTPSFQGICLALLTGAPGTAKRLMIANGPSLYPQATVDLFVAKLAELE